LQGQGNSRILLEGVPIGIIPLQLCSNEQFQIVTRNATFQTYVALLKILYFSTDVYNLSYAIKARSQEIELRICPSG